MSSQQATTCTTKRKTPCDPARRCRRRSAGRTGRHEVLLEVVAVQLGAAEDDGLVHLVLVNGGLGVLELENLDGLRLGLGRRRPWTAAIAGVHAVRFQAAARRVPCAAEAKGCRRESKTGTGRGTCQRAACVCMRRGGPSGRRTCPSGDPPARLCGGQCPERCPGPEREAVAR